MISIEEDAVAEEALATLSLVEMLQEFAGQVAELSRQMTLQVVHWQFLP